MQIFKRYRNRFEILFQRIFIYVYITKKFTEDLITEIGIRKKKGTIMIITIKNNGINGYPNYLLLLY